MHPIWKKKSSYYDNTFFFFLQVLYFLFITYMWQDLNFKGHSYNFIDVTNTGCYEILTLLQVLEAYI